MKGAIFFSGKYGSTEQYAKWISKATGLPVFDIANKNTDLSTYDYVILGSSVLYFKLTMRTWIKANASLLEGRTKILFSVSGAGPSEKLERWVADSIPPKILAQVEHIALRGRLDHSKVSWWVRLILKIASFFNPDSGARKDERYGFDYIDKESIAPIVELHRQFIYGSKTRAQWL